MVGTIPTAEELSMIIFAGDGKATIIREITNIPQYQITYSNNPSQFLVLPKNRKKSEFPNIKVSIDIIVNPNYISLTYFYIKILIFLYILDYLSQKRNVDFIQYKE